MKVSKATIMIVDDEPKNLDVLEAMLRLEHYDVMAFPRGGLALDAARECTPDLALLDIRMPGMDGYELCRRFKGDDRLRDVPVIFLSALMETQDKVLAFEVGAVDYIPKPLSEPEVLARVRTHLSLRQHALHLEELVQQRTCDLHVAHRRLKVWDMAKTHWIGMLAHELRTPLTGVFCIANALFREVPPETDLSDLRADYDWSCGRIRKMIDDATTLATIDVANDAFGVEALPLDLALNSAVARARRTAADVAFDLPPEPSPELSALASADLLGRALADLLVTAACCTPAGGRVTVGLRRKEPCAAVTIATSGAQLPQEDLDTFFEVGGQRTLLKGGADFGLGPALAQRILQLFEGSVTVQNGPAHGVVITVLLPLAAR